MFVGKRPVEERLGVFILSLATRYRQRGFNATHINLPMSRHDITNYLGMAPETLSRLFRNFQERGWIKVQGKSCIILEEMELMKLAHQCVETNEQNREAV